MTFLSDYRKTNPGLHLLYVKWAVIDLNKIETALKSFDASSRLSMSLPIQKLIEARDQLIAEEAQFYDAWEILQSLKGGDVSADSLDDNDVEALMPTELKLETRT